MPGFNLIEALKTSDVVRGDNWTVVVRRNEKGVWWAHVLWCGEGFIHIGFPNKECAEQWASGILDGCEERRDEDVS